VLLITSRLVTSKSSWKILRHGLETDLIWGVLYDQGVRSMHGIGVFNVRLESEKFYLLRGNVRCW